MVVHNSESQSQSVILFIEGIGKNDSWIDRGELSVASNDSVFRENVVHNIVESAVNCQLKDVQLVLADCDRGEIAVSVFSLDLGVNVFSRGASNREKIRNFECSEVVNDALLLSVVEVRMKQVDVEIFSLDFLGKRSMNVHSLGSFFYAFFIQDL